MMCRPKTSKRHIAAAASAAALVGLLSGAALAQQVLGMETGPTKPESDRTPATVSELRKAYMRPDAIPFPKENAYTPAKEQLGKKLFFDPRLSGANVQSCASCHSPSFTWGDGLPKGVGHGMNTLARRTPTIINAAWGDIFMWDGRKATIEEQALGPIETAGEMNMPLDVLPKKLEAIPEYKALFEKAFPGDGKIDVQKIAKAIATYERTVVSAPAPFDRWIAGDEKAISESAKNGFAVFNDKGRCAQCHASWRFTDDSFHDIGLSDDDIGRSKYLPDIVKMQHAFKTPGLRNVARRKPYMHDGSIPDLAGVIEHYNKGGVARPSRADEVLPLGLTAQESKDLVAFLETLTSADSVVTAVELPR